MLRGISSKLIEEINEKIAIMEGKLNEQNKKTHRMFLDLKTLMAASKTGSNDTALKKIWINNEVSKLSRDRGEKKKNKCKDDLSNKIDKTIPRKMNLPRGSIYKMENVNTNQVSLNPPVDAIHDMEESHFNSVAIGNTDPEENQAI